MLGQAFLTARYAVSESINLPTDAMCVSEADKNCSSSTETAWLLRPLSYQGFVTVWAALVKIREWENSTTIFLMCAVLRRSNIRKCSVAIASEIRAAARCFLREFNIAFDPSSLVSGPVHFVCGLAQSVHADNGVGVAVWLCRQYRNPTLSQNSLE